MRITAGGRRWGRLGVVWVSCGRCPSGPPRRSRRRAVETVPGMPPVPDPGEPLQRDGGGQAEPGGGGGAPARLRAEREVQRRLRDRSRHAQGGRHASASASTRSTWCPSWDLKTLWVTNNAEGRTDGSLTPIDPADGQGRASPSPSTTRTTCTSRPTASRRSSSPRRSSGSTSATRRRWRCSRSLAVPQCAGINHADFSIDGRFAIFTCEFQGSLAKIDLVDRKVLGYLKLSRGGMPQDIRVSPDGKVFYVADMKAAGVFVIDGATLHRDRLHQDRASARTASTRAATAPSSTSPTAARSHIGGPPHGKGSVSVIDFATRKVVATWPMPGRRQPRHGQRQRRRQDAVALRPLRQRRLRHRHGDAAR